MVLGTKGIGEKLDGHLDGHIHKWDGGHVLNVEQKKRVVPMGRCPWGPILSKQRL